MQKSKSHGSSVSRRQFLGTGAAAGAVRLPEQARPLAGASTMLTVDYRKLVSRADLTYIEPVARSEEGMPVGNGRMGSLVGTSPAAIKFQINRVDVFANNRDSRSFPERHTDYSAGCGYVDIDFGDFGDDVFAAPGFRQHLAVYDALATVQVGNRVWRAATPREGGSPAVLTPPGVRNGGGGRRLGEPQRFACASHKSRTA